MVLQSKLFRGDPKLEAAALSDSAHILPGARGPHVVKIQQALIQLDRAEIEPDGIYGPVTAETVADFKRKQKPPILNIAGKIDNIVGIKTMAALDAGLLEKGKAGGLGLNFKLVDSDTVPASQSIADIVVFFFGSVEHGRILDGDAVLRRRVISTYTSVPGEPLGSNVLRHPNNGRFLLRVGRSTNSIGDSLFVFTSIVIELVKLLSRLKAVPGKIFIHGSSSGANNAIDFAAHLTRVGKGVLNPHFVAAEEAVFFQEDTQDRPASEDFPLSTIPNFSMNAGSTPIPNRHNFFQSQGNHATRVLSPFSKFFGSLIFTSEMDGGEIHGRVSGFQNHDRTRPLRKPKDAPFVKNEDEFLHGEVINRTIPEVEEMIAEELLLRTL